MNISNDYCDLKINNDEIILTSNYSEITFGFNPTVGKNIKNIKSSYKLNEFRSFEVNEVRKLMVSKLLIPFIIIIVCLILSVFLAIIVIPLLIYLFIVINKVRDIYTVVGYTKSNKKVGIFLSGNLSECQSVVKELNSK